MSVDYNIPEDGMQDIHCLCIDQELIKCLKLINSWMDNSSSAYVHSTVSIIKLHDLKINTLHKSNKQ